MPGTPRGLPLRRGMMGRMVLFFEQLQRLLLLWLHLPFLALRLFRRFASSFAMVAFPKGSDNFHMFDPILFWRHV